MVYLATGSLVFLEKPLVEKLAAALALVPDCSFLWSLKKVGGRGEGIIVIDMACEPSPSQREGACCGSGVQAAQQDSYPTKLHVVPHLVSISFLSPPGCITRLPVPTPSFPLQESQGFLPSDLDSSKVIISPWMPQPAVLGHPAVKVFVSHCGMSSTNEGLAAGKPFLAMPFFADQPINAQHLQDKGVGIQVRTGEGGLRCVERYCAPRGLSSTQQRTNEWGDGLAGGSVECCAECG